MYDRVILISDKIDNGEYSINEIATTFKNILAPVNNLLEMVNISKAETARNPAWHIFLAKNNFGCKPSMLINSGRKSALIILLMK